MNGRSRTLRALGRREQGIALFLSLIMLLILTILGISSIETTSMQERMARNAMDSDMAFQAAESAAQDGEDYIEHNINSLTPFDASNAASNGLYYNQPYDQTPNWDDVNWSGGDVRTAETSVTGVAVQPKYIIEHIKTVISQQDNLNLNNIGEGTGSGRTQVFRITAYGTGGTSSAHAMVQVTYGKRF